MNTKDQLLDLHHDIYLQTSTGYEAWLSQAAVDMGKGNVASDEHVDVKLTNGTVSSDRLRIYRWRRGRQVRRQCRDASGQSEHRAGGSAGHRIRSAGGAGTGARTRVDPPAKARHTPRQDQQPEMISMMMLFAARRSTSELGGSQTGFADWRFRSRCSRPATPVRRARCRACPTPCRAFRKTATSRSRSRPRRWRCATRKRKRRSPAM